MSNPPCEVFGCCDCKAAEYQAEVSSSLELSMLIITLGFILRLIVIISAKYYKLDVGYLPELILFVGLAFRWLFQ
jgi:hypothetical protein